MTRPAQSIVARLELEAVGPDAWVNQPHPKERRLFGGLLVAQSLRAAQLTVKSDRTAQSVHGSFLRPGDGRVPVHYAVESTRSGTSFSTRRVVASQGAHAVFVATASFHAEEAGAEYQSPATPGVPAPDELPVGRYDSPWFESRDVPPSAGDHTRRAWFRARVQLPDDAALHAQALAYLTDHGPTRAVRQPHADHPGVEQRMSVSLDHTVWLHRPARVDDWLVLELTPISTGGGLGLAFGSVRTATGLLVASVAQEALLRLPSP